MKEVKLIFMKGGRVRILAEGVNGKGTEGFTMELANEIGRIVERHRGPSYVHMGATAPQIQVNNT